MTYLITGGCGFLGSNLAAHALSMSAPVAVFDNLSRSGAKTNLAWLRSLGSFDFVPGDIRNAKQVQEVIARIRPDVVFHLAGQVAMTASLQHPRYDFDVNGLGTLNVLEAVRKNCPDAVVIYASTNKVYGDLAWVEYLETPTRYRAPAFPKGFPESLPLEFHSPYGCSKGAADQYVLDYHRSYGLKTVVFRHSSMYGGRQFATYDQGWIGWFCQQGLLTKRKALDEPFSISGSGKQVRDVLHAEDMISLYYTTVDNIGVCEGQAFNIGGGMENSLSLLELFDLLERKLDVHLQYKRMAPRQSDQKVFVADITKITSMTGWAPAVRPEQGIRKMIDWLEDTA